MRQHLGMFLLGTIALTLAVQQPLRGAQIISMEAKGNLESTAPLACVDLSFVTAGHTPADIIPGIRKCLDAGEYEKAAHLLAAFSAFGKFDSLRVADKSAHQAITVLQMNQLNAVPQDRKASLQGVLTKLREPGSVPFSQICSYLRALGPPSYQPTYMLQHGMSAFTGQGGGITQGFDAKAAWQQTLEGYLHCPN